MDNDKVSIIIPDRNGQPYLQQTIDDLLVKAEGDIEIIVAADGVWPDPIIKAHPKVTVIHFGEVHNNLGMREAINKGVNISTGKYIMKIDEHCSVGQGFDRLLKAECKPDWVVIPRRKRWDAEEWKLIEDGRPDIDYMYIEYPYLKPFDKTQGLHGAEWKRPDRAKYMIDDTPTMQGSCYFMHRVYWDKLFPNGLDSEQYGTFTQEAQEISMAAWLSGGRVVVNKRTYYAHFHKGKRGKGYGFSNEQYKKHMAGTEKGRLYCIDYWLNTKDYLHDFDWFINVKFPNMPGWEGDWRARLAADKNKDYSNLPPEQRPDWFANNTK
jgi:glycosyltransferase involved in cell wall biosynthesis